jgi:hypothetical protein
MHTGDSQRCTAVYKTADDPEVTFILANKQLGTGLSLVRPA